MCYVLNFKVISVGKTPVSLEEVSETAAQHRLYVSQNGATYRITQGGCSCDYVLAKGQGITVASFLRDVLISPGVKSIEVCWSWGKWNLPVKDIARITLEMFENRNEAGALESECWYRIYDPQKFAAGTERSQSNR